MNHTPNQPAVLPCISPEISCPAAFSNVARSPVKRSQYRPRLCHAVQRGTLAQTFTHSRHCDGDGIVKRVLIEFHAPFMIPYPWRPHSADVPPSGGHAFSPASAVRSSSPPPPLPPPPVLSCVSSRSNSRCNAMLPSTTSSLASVAVILLV